MPVPGIAKIVITVVVVGALAFVGLVAAWVFNPAWDSCASFVGGRLVEHDCQGDRESLSSEQTSALGA